MLNQNILNIVISTFLLSFLTTYLMSFFFLKNFPIGSDSKKGIQKIHTTKAIRLGGIVLVTSINVIFFIFDIYEKWIIQFYLFISPILIIAVLEDINKNISVKLRLIVIVVSSFLLIINSGEIVNDVDIYWVNNFLSIFYIGLFFTVIGYTATINALNFIDGLNGLSSGLALIILTSMYFLTKNSYIPEIDTFILINIFAILGFYLINVFTGKVFLGDVGSYYLGVLIASLGVKIHFYSEISAWIIFIFILYPATELIFSFFRRLLKKKSPFKPDNLHLHSILFQILNSRIKKIPTLYINSFSGFIMVIFGSVPIILISIFNYENFGKIITLATFILFYFCSLFTLNYYNKK